MLTEKRYELILELLDKKRSVTVPEIKEVLGVSESTIRRDLNALDKAGRLIVLESENQAAKITIDDVAAYCLVNESGAVSYYMRK